MRQFIILLFVASLLILNQNSFAAIQLSEAQKGTLNQFFNDDPLRSKWSSLLQFLPASENMDLQILTAQTTYKAGSARVKQAISVIEAAHVKQLESNYASIQKKYAPLFTHYKALNVQFTALPAKSAASLRKATRLQINALRPAVLLARTTISIARTKLQEARKLRSAKVAAARTKWRILQSHTRNYAITKARIKLQESHLRTEWKSLLKQKDRSTAAVSLQICYQFAQALLEMKQNYLDQITAINQSVDALVKQF
jgi:hypothetical protein